VSKWSDWPLLLGLALCSLPLFILHPPPWGLWAGFGALNFLLLVSALRNRSHEAILPALILTALAATGWLWGHHEFISSLWAYLGPSIGLAVFFGIGGSLLMRQCKSETAGAEDKALPKGAEVLISAAMVPLLLLQLPFALLQLDSPTPVYATAAGLCILLLGLGTWMRLDGLFLVALLGALLLQAHWHAKLEVVHDAGLEICWHCGFALLFAAPPFIFRQRLMPRTLTWITAPLSLGLHFWLVHFTIRKTWPDFPDGLTALAFAVVTLAGLWILAQQRKENVPDRDLRLAWFGGIALMFITLIFPLQYDRQWLTLAWALQGSALCWLFRRVPHPGLRLTGVVLLATAFARLALNPAVLHYQKLTASALGNWQLVVYSTAAASLLCAGHWLKGRDNMGGIAWRPSLFAGGGILLFILLNLEIARYFTPQGAEYITLEWTANLAQSVTYSIAWGVFALGCMIIGFWQRQRGPRFAGVALMGFTLLKLFLHDLSSVDSLSRIVVFIGVAIIALAASFLYQRFFATKEKPDIAPVPRSDGLQTVAAPPAAAPPAAAPPAAGRVADSAKQEPSSVDEW
jgi:hypothetical protein